MLEIRLRTLADVVDVFVIVEGDQSFTGIDKPLLGASLMEGRLAPWRNKIRWLTAPLSSHVADPSHSESLAWQREFFQRNWLAKGYEDARPEDMIIIADLDEIPNPETLIALRKSGAYHNTVCLEMEVYSFFLNYKQLNPLYPVTPPWKHWYYRYLRGKYFPTTELTTTWHATVVTKGSDNRSPQTLRNLAFDKYLSIRPVANAGWHFTYMGGIDAIRKKLISFAHTEISHLADISDKDFEKLLTTGKGLIQPQDRFQIIKDLSKLPQPIQSNLESYRHMIIG